MGIVILAMVLETAGIPTAGIVLIMGVDRILDMSRTAVNVCGDMVAAKLMNRWMIKTKILTAPNTSEATG
jgi:Na+/H+-dicarboxylate symporter